MSDTKYCKHCDRTLPITRFNKNKGTKDGLTFYCKDCVAEYGRKYRSTPEGMYSNIKSRQAYWRRKGSPKAKPFEITKTFFLKWHHSQIKQCVYCDLPESKIHLTQNYFSRARVQLGVDCKDNSLGYAEGNIVLCCDTCNFVKSGVFSFDEFREIAQKYLKTKWQSCV